ncbi:MAG: hypothetical protein ACI9ZV_000616 [Candidatus Azotimanducaceae bacterium]|jgi:hypothetical protein
MPHTHGGRETGLFTKLAVIETSYKTTNSVAHKFCFHSAASVIVSLALPEITLLEKPFYYPCRAHLLIKSPKN